jgi:hypothetical protein
MHQVQEKEGLGGETNDSINKIHVRKNDGKEVKERKSYV